MPVTSARQHRQRPKKSPCGPPSTDPSLPVALLALDVLLQVQCYGGPLADRDSATNTRSVAGGIITAADHLEAARVMNVSRANGVQAASMDALIAAMALERGALLLTSDKDHLHIAENLQLEVRYVPSSD